LKGYLLHEQSFVAGEDTFVDSVSSENNYAVVFEDDTESGYFYALEMDKDSGEQKILDAVHIYNVESLEDEQKPGVLKIIWSRNWLACALVINNRCQAVFDFKNQGGYNRNGFPPPNAIWTKGSRALTDALVASLFS
jgi:hypothetical protein